MPVHNVLGYDTTLEHVRCTLDNYIRRKKNTVWGFKH